MLHQNQNLRGISIRLKDDGTVISLAADTSGNGNYLTNQHHFKVFCSYPGYERPLMVFRRLDNRCRWVLPEGYIDRGGPKNYHLALAEVAGDDGVYRVADLYQPRYRNHWCLWEVKLPFMKNITTGQIRPLQKLEDIEKEVRDHHHQDP